MTRPRITASVKRGLSSCAGLVGINLRNGPDGSDWVECMSDRDVADAEAALNYIEALLESYKPVQAAKPARRRPAREVDPDLLRESDERDAFNERLDNIRNEK
jgi:hypothetical protein